MDGQPHESQRPSQATSDSVVGHGESIAKQVTTTKYQVEDVYYGVHTKRGADENAPKTLRVDYRVGWHQYKSEWICLEHDGYARQKAVAWWRRRSPDPVPDSIERAIEIIEGGGLATTRGITVRAGEPYERIIDYELGPMPEAVAAQEPLGYDPDDCPF